MIEENGMSAACACCIGVHNDCNDGRKLTAPTHKMPDRLRDTSCGQVDVSIRAYQVIRMPQSSSSFLLTFCDPPREEGSQQAHEMLTHHFPLPRKPVIRRSLSAD